MQIDSKKINEAVSKAELFNILVPIAASLTNINNTLDALLECDDKPRAREYLSEVETDLNKLFDRMENLIEED